MSCYRDKVRGEVDGFTEFDPDRGVALCLARFDVFHRDMSFEEFVEAVVSIADEDADEHFRAQSTFLIGGDGAVSIDFVGKYETLQRDFDHVARTIGLPDMELPCCRSSSHNHATSDCGRH